MYAAAAKSCKMNMFKAVVQSKVLNQKKLPVTAKIILNPLKKAYNPGNEILGHVEVTFNDEFVYYGIKLVLEGFIHIKYRENDRPYEKRDSILTESIYLVGVPGMQKIRSKPGTNSIYSFTIAIPSTDIPGTYQGSFGSINYHLRVYVDYGENKLVRRADKQIMINSQLDLDPDDSSNSEPITFERSYTTGFKQISYNKKKCDPELRFTLRLEQGGYICGEDMEFDVDLENPKNIYKVSRVTVALIQRVTYHGGIILKVINTILNSAVVPSPTMDPADFIPPYQDNPWKGILQIPRGLVPTQNGTIEFEYFIKVTVDMKKTKDKLSGECPITMGITRDGISADAEQEGSTFYASVNADPSSRKELESGDE